MSGLWSQPGVPHKGWRCVDVDDLRPPEGDDYEHATCQMCLNEKLRFVHTMEHDEYPVKLEVGCVCAEKMAEEYDGKAREQHLRNRAARKSKWLTRKWRISGKGNHFLNIDGYNVGVFPDKFHLAKWKWRIDDDFGRERFDTPHAAKLALFDVLADRLEW
jgi:hypothetical protein